MYYIFMFIEHYNAYIINSTTKNVKKVKVKADTAIIAHKKAMMDTSAISEEITKITDSQGVAVYTLKDGFLEPAA